MITSSFLTAFELYTATFKFLLKT